MNYQSSIKVGRRPADQRAGPSTLANGLKVLSLLKDVWPEGLGATEISRRTGIDRVTVQRSFLALEGSAWVRRNKSGKRYFSGDDVDTMNARLWMPPSISQDLLLAAMEGMRKLAKQLGDAIFLIGRDGTESVGLHREIGDYHPSKLPWEAAPVRCRVCRNGTAVCTFGHRGQIRGECQFNTS